jgi:predicted GNAT superfamily acetyltransferase
MSIRSLSPADLPAVLALNNAAVPAVGPLDESQLAHLVDQSMMALVATADSGADRVVGFCLVLLPGAEYGSVNYRWFSQRYSDFVYLDRVVIDPDFHGRGLGRQLYHQVEQASTAQWFTLEVNLRPLNQPSLAFHERLGFHEVGRLETDYGAVVSMHAKQLQPERA